MSQQPLLDDGEDSDVDLLLAENDELLIDGILDITVPLQSARGMSASAREEFDYTMPEALPGSTALQNQSDHQLIILGQQTCATSQSDDRARHRNRRHHRHGNSGSRRHSRLCRFKRKESNFLAAVCSLIVVVLIGVSLIEPRWFYVHGGRCLDGSQPAEYLALKLFLYFNSSVVVDAEHRNEFRYGTAPSEVLYDCVTADIVFLLEVIIALCFLAFVFSLISCVLDLIGPTHVICRAIRCTASLSILTVCICITILGLCYLVTQELTNYYSGHRLHANSRVDVQFDIGFYIMTAAGAMAVVAVACSLFRIRSTGSSRNWSSISPAVFDPETLQRDEALIQARFEQRHRVPLSCSQDSPLPPAYSP